jgi:hypothetical protein
MRVKVASCAYLGRFEEARVWLNGLLEIQPGFTVAVFKEYFGSFPPKLMAIFVEGLRKAGLPEQRGNL